MVIDTLYDKLKAVEKFDRELRELHDSAKFDLAQTQRELFAKYKNNPVLKDAMSGKQSIEDSLMELAKIRTPVRRLFPIKANKAHNERLKQFGKLVNPPIHLKTGLLYADNFATGFLGAIAISYGTMYAVSSYLTFPNNEEVVIASVNALVMSPVLGLMCHLNGNRYLPVEESKYLDEKISNLYGGCSK